MDACYKNPLIFISLFLSRHWILKTDLATERERHLPNLSLYHWSSPLLNQPKVPTTTATQRQRKRHSKLEFALVLSSSPLFYMHFIQFVKCRGTFQEVILKLGMYLSSEKELFSCVHVLHKT